MVVRRVIILKVMYSKDCSNMNRFGRVCWRRMFVVVGYVCILFSIMNVFGFLFSMEEVM